jgi:hypothetical protein
MLRKAMIDFRRLVEISETAAFFPGEIERLYIPLGRKRRTGGEKGEGIFEN